MSNRERSTPDERVGDIIRSVRNDADLTQGELAELMSAITGTSLHKTTISKIEAGQRPLSFVEAAAVSFLLPVPLSELAHPLRPAGVIQKWERALASFEDFSRQLSHIGAECDLTAEDLSDVEEYVDDDASKRGPLAEKRERLQELVPAMNKFAMDTTAQIYKLAGEFSKYHRDASA